MTRLGVGIVGCGNISTAYCELAPMYRSIEMRACADLDSDIAAARAAEFGLTACTVDEVMARDDIDIVLNLTVPAAHSEISLRAIAAGKHVYSEKPFVLSVDEGLALKLRAKERGLRVGSAPDTFLGGSHQHVRSLVDTGSIGKVLSATAHVMSRGMEHWHPNPDFFYQPGGGPVLDVGPYYITNLIQLIGPVARVQAVCTTPFSEREVTAEERRVDRVPVGTPTTVHALLEFVSGAVATLGTSWDVHRHTQPFMELHGETGSVSLPDPNFFSGDVSLWRSAEEPDSLEAFSHPFGVTNFEDNNGVPRANYRAAGLADMAMAIQENRAHRCNDALALHAVDVMTSILAAGESGAPIELSTTCDRPEALSAKQAQALLVEASA